MLMHILSSSLLIVCVLLIRALFRGKVPYRMLYLLWIPVFLRLVIPGTVFEFSVFPQQQDAVFGSAFEWLSQDTEDSAEQNVPSESPMGDSRVTQISPDISAKDVLLVIYLVGCIAVGGRFCLLSFSVRRSLQRNRSFLMKYKHIRVYRTDCALAPCAHGLIPAIYLTYDTACSETESLILEHEYTHIRHLDFLRAFLRRAAAVLYWRNPLVWLYVRFAAEDAELACDEAVAARLDTNTRLQYAQTIYALLPQNRHGSLGFVGKPLKRRILALTTQRANRIPSTVLAVFLITAASFMCVCGLSETVSQTPQDDFVSQDWCSELFPPDFPVPIYDEIFEIKQDDGVVTVTLFAEPGPVSDFLPSHNLTKRLTKSGFVLFYDFETRRQYFLNKEGYHVTIYSNLNAGWLYELNKQNPYGYTYQIKLEKIEHSFESIFWQYPYKKTDLGLKRIFFESYPSEYLPAQFPHPEEKSALRITSALQDENGVFLRTEGHIDDFWQFNRAISDAGFYFIDTGGEDFFFVDANGDYLFARIVSMATDAQQPSVFEYQVCKFNPLVEK